MVWTTPYLNYHAVVSASGPKLTLSSGAGSNFAPGDLVVLHGATKYFGPGSEYDVYRNYLRARVVEASEDHLVIDRAMPVQLLADSPVIGNASEDLPVSSPALGFYMLYAPHFSNLRLSSDLGEAFRFGGTIDGTFRDLTIDARSAITLNAMQDCLFENIRFRAWRVICELGEGSYGTVVRNMRGSLTDASARFGGASDAAPFFIALGENCAECVLEDLSVDSGPNDTTGGVAVLLGSGRNNEVRNSRMRFPAFTGRALAVQAHSAPGNPVVDSGFHNLTVTAPLCSQFFTCNDPGAGVLRPYLEASRFYGAPSLRAATLRGEQGRLIDNFFESGDVYLDPAANGWRVEGNTINGSIVFQGGTNNIVRGNYIRDGFSGLSNAVLQTSIVSDNESDASRRLNAAGVVLNNQGAITTTAPFTAYRSATFAAGDLAPGDSIFVLTKAATGAGTSDRFARLSVTQGGTTTALGSATVAGALAPVSIRGSIEIRTDTFVVGEFVIGDKRFHTLTSVASIAANGLRVNLEYWVSNTGEPIDVRTVRIVAVKPGLRSLPLE